MSRNTSHLDLAFGGSTVARAEEPTMFMLPQQRNRDWRILRVEIHAIWLWPMKLISKIVTQYYI